MKLLQLLFRPPLYRYLLLFLFLGVTTSVFSQVNGYRYVDASRASSGDGTTWTKAYKTLKEALTEANANTSIIQIHVAKGTYYPTGAQSGTDRVETFGIYRSDLAILGGYPSGGGERNWNINPTILSGEINNTLTTDDNSYHVMVIAGVYGEVLIEGVQVIWGRATGGTTEDIYNGQKIQRNGGAGIAIYGNGADIEIRNCKIAGNWAGDVGAGVYIKNSSPNLNSCLISGNYADYGGGIFAYSTSGTRTSSDVVNCTIVGNHANHDAGGIRNSGSRTSTRIHSSIVYGNSGPTGVTNNEGGSFEAGFSIVEGIDFTYHQDIYKNLPGNTDPLFISVVAPTSANIDGDYRLQANSPCIGSGDYDYLTIFGLYEHDLANNRRKTCALDIGAYEAPDYPVIQTQPTNKTICEATSTSFSIVATNVDRYEWQVKKAGTNVFVKLTNGGIYSGVSTANLNVNDVPVNENKNVYRCVMWKNECVSTTSGQALLTVKPLPKIELQPIAQSICEQAGTSFTIQANNATSYRWEYNDGSGFKDVPSAAPYTGINTATLQISSVTAQMNNYNYRVIASGECGSVPSSSAKLTVVGPVAVISQQPTDQVACMNSKVSFTVQADNATRYGWEYDDGSGFRTVPPVDASPPESNVNATLQIIATDKVKNYTYRAVVSGACPTAVFSSPVKLATIHSAPVIASQEYCNQSATVADLLLLGSNLKWYTSSSGGNALASITSLSTGTYYVSQDFGSCQTPRASVSVKSTARPLGNTTQLVVMGSKFSNLSAMFMGTNLKWYDAAEGGNEIPPSTVVGLRKYYVSQTIDNCESARLEIDVKSFPSTTAYVKPGATGSGASWQDTSGDLQAMINIIGVEQVWVAGGTYHPIHRAGNGTTDRDKSFVLKKGVKVYGGFAGTETTLSERDLSNKANVSILSGDFNNNDQITGTGSTLSITGNAENAYHVVIAAGDLAGTTLNGFTITGGNADGGSSITLHSHEIYRGDGGGILVKESTTNNNEFLLSHLIIQGNYAHVGAGIYHWSSYSYVSHVLICRNLGNESSAINNNSGYIELYHATIVGNRTSSGGSIHNSNTIVVRSSLMWGNMGGVSNPHSNPYSTVDIFSYSIIQGIPVSHMYSDNLLSTDPLFMDAANGDYRLQPCSPAINAGDKNVIGAIDLNGHPRIQHKGVDMGAYEANSIVSGQAQLVTTSTESVSAYQLNSGITKYGSDCNSLLLTLSSTGTSPIEGMTEVSVWIDELPDYVGRHYEIAPENNASTSTGKVTLYFTQAEFDAYNEGHKDQLPSGPTDATGIANLRIEKRSGESSDGSGHPSTYTGSPQVIDPADEDIVWNASLGRWEVSFSVVGFSGFFAYAVDHVALPVTLVDFQAVQEEQNIVLSWQTSEEWKASHFAIERSATTQEWTTLGEVEAMGDYRDTKDYQFVDALALASTGYYRLKMVDRDGSFTYSNIISVMTSAHEVKVMVYPNPATSNWVRIESDELADSEIRLFNAQGVQIDYTLRNRNVTNTELEIGHLPAGVYVLRITRGKQVTVRSFLVIR